MNVLLLGCGIRRQRNILFEGAMTDFSKDNLTTVDIDPDSKPDILMDLNVVTLGEKLPFDDESFDEIHAYDFLEHIGKQGDWREFFVEFGEYHRILNNNGRLFITVPIGEDALADPGHSRFFHINHFGFLNQEFYDRNRDLHTTATDYRWFWKKNFDVDFMEKQDNHHIAVVLRKT